MRIKSVGSSDHQGLNSFGDRVTHILKEMRLTKTWLAQQLEVSKQNINYLLHYASKPRYVSKISNLLEVNKEWLKTGNGPINKMGKSNPQHFHIIPLFTSHGLEESSSSSWDPNAADAGLLAEIDTPSKAFAIRLEHDLGEPMFKSGNTLIFMPQTRPSMQHYQLVSCDNNSKLVLRHPTLNQQRIIYSRKQQQKNEEGSASAPEIETIGIMIEVRVTFDNPQPRSLNEIKIKLS